MIGDVAVVADAILALGSTSRTLQGREEKKGRRRGDETGGIRQIYRAAFLSPKRGE